MPEKLRAGNSFISTVAMSRTLCSMVPAQKQRVPPPTATAAQLLAIRCSNAELAAVAVDPKFKLEPGARRPVYVSRKENVRRIEGRLRARLPAADFALIEVRQLPDDPAENREHGLLY